MKKIMFLVIMLSSLFVFAEPRDCDGYYCGLKNYEVQAKSKLTFEEAEKLGEEIFKVASRAREEKSSAAYALYLLSANTYMRMVKKGNGLEYDFHCVYMAAIAAESAYNNALDLYKPQIARMWWNFKKSETDLMIKTKRKAEDIKENYQWLVKNKEFIGDMWYKINDQVEYYKNFF